MPRRIKNISEERLHELLCTQRKSYMEAARLLNCSNTSVKRFADGYGIIPIQNRLVDEDFFFKDSGDLYYALGLLATDGYVGDDGRIGIELIDREVIDWLSEKLAYKGSIHRRQRKGGKPTYSIRFTSSKVSEKLETFGITPRKSTTLAIQNIPSDYYIDFIRGAFEGDGSVSFGKSRSRNNMYYVFSIASASETFAKQLAGMILESMGVVCSLTSTGTKEDEKPIYKISVRNIPGLSQVIDSLYRGFDAGMTRKKKIFSDIREYFQERGAA